MENRYKLLSAGVLLAFASIACALAAEPAPAPITNALSSSGQALTETATPTPLKCETTTTRKLNDAFEIKTKEIFRPDVSDDGENFCWGIIDGYMKNEYAVDPSVPVERWGFVDFGDAEFLKFKVYDVLKLNSDNTIREIDTVIDSQSNPNVPFLVSDTGGISLTEKQYDEMVKKHEPILYLRKIFSPLEHNRVLKTFRAAQILRQA